MINSIPITESGFKKLVDELTYLKTVKRRQLAQDISDAAKHGDLSENHEHKAAKEEQTLNEKKIAELEFVFGNSHVIDIVELSDSEEIKFGATVTLLDVEKDKSVRYQIVGEYEADINCNRISVTSPFASALIGRKVGEYIEFSTASGVREYEILNIEYIALSND